MRPILRLAAVLILFGLASGAARAADLAVTVRNAAGKPIADAVVTVPGRASGPFRFAWPYRMAQHNMQFDPFVLVVPVGAEVAFPNLDRVRHHVYSFSAPHPFELKLYGRDETRIVRFDKPGIVALGCNIHDSMVAFIVVVDTPFAAKTDAAGQAILRGVPAGVVSVKLWHPYLRAPGNTLTASVAVPREGVGRAALTAEVRAAPDRRRMY
jgi:plastocyanin